MLSKRIATMTMAAMAGLLLLFPGGLRADRPAGFLNEDLQKKFFETLSEPEIIRLLTEVDRAGQLTDGERGAKYRWGLIPSDRTPPRSLARWWRSLSKRGRTEQRLDWFDEQGEQLRPTRVARVLGLQKRLDRVERLLERKDEPSSPESLEPVFFSSGPTTPEATPNQTESAMGAVHDQNRPGPHSKRDPSSRRNRGGSGAADQLTDDVAPPAKDSPDRTSQAASAKRPKNRSSDASHEQGVRREATPENDHVSKTGNKDRGRKRSGAKGRLRGVEQVPELRRPQSAIETPALRRP